MNTLVAAIRAALPRYRFTFDSEAKFQTQLEEFFTREKFDFDREVRLTPRERADFVLYWKGLRIVIEAKVGGAIEGHLRQLKRYANLGPVHGVIMVGTRPYSVPQTLSAKPVAAINLGGNRL